MRADRPGRGSLSPWWRPDAYARRRKHLVMRGQVRSRLRDWFATADFVEVETPALQVSPGWEAHIQPFMARMENGGATAKHYLRTSPEIAMKKLLAAGETRIYQLCQAYRNDEASPLHQPEFTILEWYRAGASVDAVIEDCLSLIRMCAGSAGRRIQRGGCNCDIGGPWRRLSVAEAFEAYAGMDVLASLSDPNKPDRGRLALDAAGCGVSVGEDDAWDDIFHKIFYAHIQPRLGVYQPDILTDYPAPLASLAALSPDDSRVSQRFEVFIHGIELANGCAELIDPADHRRRYRREQSVKRRRYGRRVPADMDFLAAVDHGLPECAGVALGFDRLILLLSGAADIRDVLWEPLV